MPSSGCARLVARVAAWASTGLDNFMASSISERAMPDSGTMLFVVLHPRRGQRPNRPVARKVRFVLFMHVTSPMQAGSPARDPCSWERCRAFQNAPDHRHERPRHLLADPTVRLVPPRHQPGDGTQTRRTYNHLTESFAHRHYVGLILISAAWPNGVWRAIGCAPFWPIVWGVQMRRARAKAMRLLAIIPASPATRATASAPSCAIDRRATN